MNSLMIAPTRNDRAVSRSERDGPSMDYRRRRLAQPGAGCVAPHAHRPEEKLSLPHVRADRRLISTTAIITALAVIVNRAIGGSRGAYATSSLTIESDGEWLWADAA